MNNHKTRVTACLKTWNLGEFSSHQGKVIRELTKNQGGIRKNFLLVITCVDIAVCFKDVAAY